MPCDVKDSAVLGAMTLRFYYDIVCPFAYVAFTRVAALAAEAGVDVDYRPILLGGLLRGVGSPVVPMDAMNPAKLRLTELDAYRQAELAGLEVQYPDSHPIRTVNAMRLVLAARDADRVALSTDLYRAYWEENRDVSDLDVLQEIAAPYGLDARSVSADPAVRQGLFDATAQAVDAGAFGVPTFEIDGVIFWGADRMNLVRAALGLAPAHEDTAGTGRKLVFFHDMSSPFSYLASTQVARVALEGGAELEYVPFLLGALFNAIGTPMVPLFTFSEARQAYQRRDMADWASWWGVPFKFPSEFPLRTVSALRVAIQDPATTPHLYAAAWADDRNIGKPEVLHAVLAQAGFDADALMAGTQNPEIKAQLRRNTERAQASGVCGAPTFQVDGGSLYWGQDRLPMVQRALAGWDPRRG